CRGIAWRSSAAVSVIPVSHLAKKAWHGPFAQYTAPPRRYGAKVAYRCLTPAEGRAMLVFTGPNHARGVVMRLKHHYGPREVELARYASRVRDRADAIAMLVLCERRLE